MQCRHVPMCAPSCFHVLYVKNIVAKIARDTFVIFSEIVHAHIECEYVRKRYVRILFTF
jgi:hypothetical protein